MTDTNMLLCDGCGQFAPPAHITRRLQRLEWASRYRPIHIQTFLLGAVVPAQQGSYLYADGESFSGEAAALLRSVGISTEARAREGALIEFQKRGLMLGHVLECPLEGRLSTSEISGLMERQLKSAFTRIRRSLKPKRVLVFSREMAGLADKITEAELEIPVLFRDGKPFELTEGIEADALKNALNGALELQKG